jgi:hypothetical protein
MGVNDMNSRATGLLLVITLMILVIVMGITFTVHNKVLIARDLQSAAKARLAGKAEMALVSAAVKQALSM